MTTRRNGAVVIGLVAALGAWGLAQSSARAVRLSLAQGTSMAAALSPDGRTIALDLLGVLWAVPGEGGAARRLIAEWLRRARANVVA